MKEKPIITHQNFRKEYSGDTSLDRILFESAPTGVIEVREEVTAQVRAVRHSGEDGMSQFCQQSFVNPEAARIGSQALLTAFDDSGLWLSCMAQPAHLVAELRQQCCLLTRVVITQWTRQGETQKLARLAEALLDAQPPVLSHEAGQIMALLASLLGILRPALAPKWLTASRPLLRDSVDPHLLKEATLWVSIGQMLADLPQEDRLFWNRRLRDPDADWEWESPEALGALRRIAPLLKDEKDHILIFQATIPQCWWELWQDSREPSSTVAPAKSAKGGGFILGLLSGVLVSVAGVWGYGEWRQVSVSSAQGNEAKDITFHAVDGTTTNTSAVETASAKNNAPELSPAMQARHAAAQEMIAEQPELDRLRSLVANGNASEASRYIQGRSALVAQSEKLHKGLLSILMLEPPSSAELRQQINKAAVRKLDTKEMFRIIKLCLHPDSPNLTEAKECAELLLALGADSLNTEERDVLTAAAAK